jgi:hypothetical protein
MQLTHRAVTAVRQQHGHVFDNDAFFAGYHFVTTLDWLQHNPVTGLPLYAEVGPCGMTRLANEFGGDGARAAQGRALWKRVDTIHLLTQQHRFGSDDADSKALYDFVQLLWQTKALTRAEVEHIVDVLNDRVPTPDLLRELLSRSPKVIVLRNDMKPALNLRLAQTHAHNLGQRVVRWTCRDTTTTGGTLTTDLKLQMKGAPPATTGKMPSQWLFFPGCSYVFYENTAPAALWVNNNMATGVSLILDKDEPPDDFSSAYRTLQHPPRGVVVRPAGGYAAASADSSDGAAVVVPHGCVVVQPTRIKFSLKLEKPQVILHKDLVVPAGASALGAQPLAAVATIGTAPSRSKVPVAKKGVQKKVAPKKGTRKVLATPLDPATTASTVSIHRTGFAVHMGYAVTDFFSQGMSFRGDPFLMDLRPPPTGRFVAGSIRVAVTRPSSMADLHLLAPLYPPGDMQARAVVVNQYMRTLAQNTPYNDEMTRLAIVAKDTRIAYDRQFPTM